MTFIRHQPRIMRVARAIAPPLSPKVKLAIINDMLQKKQRRALTGVPSPQIVLTPTQPGSGNLTLRGTWFPPSCVMLWGTNIDNLQFWFDGLAQGTYLVDISVDSVAYTAAWTYTVAGNGGSETLTPQEGHLLYPFIGAGTFNIGIWPPNDGGIHVWNSTELTQVA